MCVCVCTCVAWVHGYVSAQGPLVGGRYIMLFPANGHRASLEFNSANPSASYTQNYALCTYCVLVFSFVQPG